MMSSCNLGGNVARIAFIYSEIQRSDTKLIMLIMLSLEHSTKEISLLLYLQIWVPSNRHFPA